MLALGAAVVATGPNGARTIALTDFFTGVFTTALNPDEILTEIRIPIPPPGSGGAYFKVERKVGDFAASFFHQQNTRRGIPRLQSKFPKSFEAAGSDAS